MQVFITVFKKWPTFDWIYSLIQVNWNKWSWWYLAELTLFSYRCSQFYVPAKRKWEAIFRQCSHSLGLPLVNAVWVKEDTSKAWEHIAIIVCQHVGKNTTDVQPLRRNGSTVTMPHSSSGSKADLSGEKRCEISEVLQRIPEYGRELLNQQQLNKIEAYLQMVRNSFL